MSKRRTTSRSKAIKNQLSLNLQPSLVAPTENIKSPRLSVVVSHFCPRKPHATSTALNPNSPEITKIIREKAKALGW